MSTRIVFSGSPLDRAEVPRRDPKWIEHHLEHTESRFLALWRLNVLVKEEPELGIAWTRGVVRESMNPDVGAVLLGIHDDVAHFAVDLSSVEDPETLLGTEGQARFEDPRAAASRLPAHEAAILAHGRARVDWHARHVYCPACGGRTRAEGAGSHRVCGSCEAEHFPRTDPVAIAVVTDGERCLLGRNKGWPGEMFSALAGFIESGETIEEAVRREVGEEAGIPVGRVDYIASQPWPFPHSLMIGCIGEALDTKIELDGFELEDARWFDKDTVRRALAGEPDTGLIVPPPMAIAHHLLRAWVERD